MINLNREQKKIRRNNDSESANALYEGGELILNAFKSDKKPQHMQTESKY